MEEQDEQNEWPSTHHSQVQINTAIPLLFSASQDRFKVFFYILAERRVHLLLEIIAK